MHILLIEDNDDDVVYIREMLGDARSDPLNVRWAGTLAAGLNSLSSGQTDAVLLDLSLPDSHGLATFDKVHAAAPDMPIVVLSGLADEAVALEAVQRGAQDYLVKGQMVGEFPLRRTLRYAVERKRVERAFHDSERRFRTLVEQLPAITYIAPADDAGAAIYISPQFEKLLGYSRADCAANPRIWQDRLHSDDREGVLALLGRCVASGTPFVVEYRMVSRDGRVLWFLDRGTVIRSADGKPLFLQGVMLDVTEQKALEFQLRQAQKMEAVGVLAGGVAHDFRNQLTVIKGYAEMLLRSEALGPDDRESVEEILDAASRSADLTGELLTFGRRQTVQPEVANPQRLVEDMVKTLTSMLGEHIHLAVTATGCPGNIEVDRGEFQHALVNLAANARDAMPKGGRFTIEIANAQLDERFARQRPEGAAGAFVMVAVGDTGVGMDDETLERVFDPFFTTKGVGQGTGLGLAMVYGFVEQAGGHVVVESEPGRGSTFRLYFPRAADATAAQRQAPRSDVRLARGSGTILLVEDEAPVRRVASKTLQACGYRVLEAANGNDALTVANRHGDRIDLLLTDMVMPGMNGAELAQRLTRLRPGIKVLYMSGYTNKVGPDDSLGKADPELLVKPFSVDTLSDRVGSVLSSQALT